MSNETLKSIVMSIKRLKEAGRTAKQIDRELGGFLLGHRAYFIWRSPRARRILREMAIAEEFKRLQK